MSAPEKPVRASSTAAPLAAGLPAGLPALLRDESVIPRSWWTFGAYAGLGLAAWGGMLWAGTASWPAELGVESATSLTEGSLPRLYSTVMLLLAAQLSFVILWYRSKSRKDFMGRYRIWGWAGLFWAIACFCQATGLHEPAARIVYERWPLACWRPQTTYWLAPFTIGFVSLFQLLGREMRHCPASRILWSGVLLLGVACGAAEMGLEALLPAPHQAAISTGLVTFWHFGIAITLLVYGRFVVHVTREAAPRAPSLALRVWRLMRAAFGKLFRRRREENSTKKPQTKASRATAAAEAKPKAKPSPTRQPPAGVPAPEQESTSWGKRLKKRVLGGQVRIDAAEPPPKPIATPLASKATAPSAVEKRTATPATRFTDHDEDDDEEYDSSSTGERLSKKERKRLKKMQRMNRAN